jgi:CDP-glycerol glycerophosphotransferase (TagB/SpsB family)
MHKSVWRLALVIGMASILAGCGNKETKEALEKSANLESQKQYYDANNVLMDALQARETKIRGDNGTQPTEQTEIDALRKKVQSDPEILKMERRWVRSRTRRRSGR